MTMGIVRSRLSSQKRNLKNNAMSHDTLLSKVISFLRFPLTVMVVFIHFSLTDGLMVHGVKHGLGNPDWFFHIVNFFSEVLARIAVPLFYMFSGFLFFNKKDFTREIYGQKLKSRARTLLVPFILWNFIAVLWQLKCLLPGLSSFYRPVEVHLSVMRIINTFLFNTGNSGIITGPPLDVASSGSYPIDVPLWYLRDLMVVIIISPLIHWMIKKASFWSVALLGIFWLTLALFLPKGCYIDMLATAVFFFSLGATFSINKMDFISLFKKFRWAPACYLVIALIDTLTKGLDYNIFIHRTGILIGMIAMVNVVAYLLQNDKIKVNPTLAGSSFFIFASHYLLIGDFGKFAFVMLHVPENNPLAMLTLYFLVPIVVTAICLALYVALKRIAPKLCSLLTGGR